VRRWHYLLAFALLAWAKLSRWVSRLSRRLLGRLTGHREERAASQPPANGRIVSAGPPEPRAEIAVIALLALAVLFAAGFIVVYAEFSPQQLPNELLGGCLAGALASIAAALAVFARRLVVTEELEEDYPPERRREQAEVAQILHESASRITRRRLLLGAGATAGGALGLAALTPAFSLGPLLDTEPLYETPWRRGARLVDRDGRPYRAQEILEATFYTAFPEGFAASEELGAAVVMVRLEASALRLPPARASWAPRGILAYSKICTHAGCAIALYRKPTFAAVEPPPALVCPCHYSTFDPASGGNVTYGPAGRPLPQLPLMIDSSGYLRAAGNFSGPVGPSWSGVRTGKAP
jgi:quinol---cytochrome c reductase iron-sulfur subunit